MKVIVLLTAGVTVAAIFATCYIRKKNSKTQIMPGIDKVGKVELDHIESHTYHPEQ